MFKKPSLVVLVASFLFLAAVSPALGQIFPGGVHTHETNKKPTGLPLPDNNENNGSEINTPPTDSVTIYSLENEGYAIHSKPDNSVPIENKENARSFTANENVSYITVDNTGEGNLENLWIRFVDTNVDNWFDNLQLSMGENQYRDNAPVDDNVVMENNDENIDTMNEWVENIRIGENYRFEIYADNTENRVWIRDNTWWSGKIFMDADGDGNPDNRVSFTLSDNDSNGNFDVLEISVVDNRFGENWTADSAFTDNDALLTSSENIYIGENSEQSYQYEVAFENDPADSSFSFSITSTSWYEGTLQIDKNSDGMTEVVNFLLSDNDSNGIFNVLEISSDDDNYVEGPLGDNDVDNNNDERLTADDNIRIGDYLYRIRGPGLAENPVGDSPDYRVRSKSWFWGPLKYVAAEGWADNFAYVVAWDENSDGVQENLAIDPNLDNDFMDSNFWYTHQDTPVKPLWLPSGMNYAWELSSFVKNQAVNNWVQFDPMDDAKPSASDFAPEENIILSAKKPTFEVTLADRGSSTAGKKTTFGDMGAAVIIQWDKDLDDVPDENLYMAGFTDNTLGADGWYRFLENEPKVEADASWSPTKEELKVTPLDVLPEGQIIVRYVAADKAYNHVDDNWSFSVDRSRPEITITEPVEEFETYDSSVKLEGVVSDMIGYRLKVNGERISAPGGSFSKEIDLKGGKNTITVQAIDDAGNKVTKERTVTRKIGKEIPTEKAPAFPTDVIVPVVAVAIVAAVIFLAVSKRS